MPLNKSSRPKVSARSSRVLVPTFSVVLPVPVCSPSTTRSNLSSSARSSRVALVKRPFLYQHTKAVRGGERLWTDIVTGPTGVALMAVVVDSTVIPLETDGRMMV
jgi:hypothetical protein